MTLIYSLACFVLLTSPVYTMHPSHIVIFNVPPPAFDKRHSKLLSFDNQTHILLGNFQHPLHKRQTTWTHSEPSYKVAMADVATTMKGFGESMGNYTTTFLDTHILTPYFCLDEKDQFAPFSKDGKCITILSPGAAILSDNKGGSTNGTKTWYSGTSYSTPHASSVVALLSNQQTISSTQQQLYDLATQGIVTNMTQDTVNLLVFNGVEASQMGSVISANNHQGSNGCLTLGRPLYWLPILAWILFYF